MRSKKRSKYPKHAVLTTSDPKAQQAFYAATDDAAPLPSHQLAAGLIQHPDTGLYQIWLSTNGLDVTCLAAYQTLNRANVALEELKAFLRTPDVYNAEKCSALFEKLKNAGASEPLPLPDDQVRQIGRGILRRVVDNNQGDV